jgi:hypothetical protein
MQGNHGNIIERLFTSFSDLEEAIESAKTTLAKKEFVPQEILNRLKSYDTILAKQRRLARDLCRFIDDGNWDEVSRHVSLINGLSAMIRDDARAILSSLSVNSDEKEEQDMVIC